MRNIDDMLNVVTAKMHDRDIEIESTVWINDRHNVIVHTKDAGSYVLKFSNQWKQAGDNTPGLDRGVGMTFNLATYLRLSILPEKPYMMFGFPESDTIFYQAWDEYQRLSATTTQPNGEEVRVILTKSLKWF